MRKLLNKLLGWRWVFIEKGGSYVIKRAIRVDAGWAVRVFLNEWSILSPNGNACGPSRWGRQWRPHTGWNGEFYTGGDDGK